MLGYPPKQHIVRGDERARLAGTMRKYSARKMHHVETHREHHEEVFDDVEPLGLRVDVQPEPNREPEGEHWRRIGPCVTMTEK